MYIIKTLATYMPVAQNMNELSFIMVNKTSNYDKIDPTQCLFKLYCPKISSMAANS